MNTAVRGLLVCLTIAAAGCDTRAPTTAAPGKGGDPKNAGGAGTPSSGRGRAKGKNPLVGRWVIAKVGKQDWSPKVSKEAVLEFHDEDSPGTGKLTVADRRADGDGYYIYEGPTGFRFEVKFRRRDGTPEGGYGGLMQISKLTDAEVVGDLFTLKRVD